MDWWEQMRRHMVAFVSLCSFFEVQAETAMPESHIFHELYTK
jgi:hypothetical protein